MIITKSTHDKKCDCGQIKLGEWYSIHWKTGEIRYNNHVIERSKVPKCIIDRMLLVYAKFGVEEENDGR